MKVPVLTYHSVNITGSEYHNNDHIALQEDLITITEMGFLVVPLADAVSPVIGKNTLLENRPVVALTFDDGAIFDFEDFVHPNCGFQKSFYRILLEFSEEAGQGRQPHLHASCFVIGSPEGRKAMDISDYGGRNWWHDDWWPSATQSGLLRIENHSWDHNHPDFPETVQKDGIRGTFENIDSLAECELEIRQASEYIHSKSTRRPQFLAYPWGQSSHYLREEYLPLFGAEIGLDAALGTGPDYLTEKSNKWNLPRFVCGEHWHSPAELVSILEGATM